MPSTFGPSQHLQPRSSRRTAAAPALIAVLVSWALSGPAQAQGAPAHAGPGAWAAWSAEQASEVLEAHCATAASGSATLSAQAVSAVGPVLAEVSAAHDATHLPYLLYWRARLNLCLDREEYGKADLEAFLSAAGDEAQYSAQVVGARRLLRRLGAAATTAPPGAVLGGVLLGTSGALYGLSAWQATVSADRLADYKLGERPWAQTEVLGEAATAAWEAQVVLLSAGVVSTTAGVVSLLITAIRARDDARGREAGRRGRVPAFAASPRPDGVTLSLGGAW